MDRDAHFNRLLADLPEALSQNETFVKNLQEYARVIYVRKGDYLLRTGELCQDAYFINKGLFMNIYINEKGNECVTGFSSEEQFPFLSAIGYFTRCPSDFEIRAIEDGELIRFSRIHIEDLSLRYPLFASYYQNVMLMIISRLYTIFAVLQSDTAEEFLKYLYKNYSWLINRVPDKYIARFMGVSTSWYCKLKKRIFN